VIQWRRSREEQTTAMRVDISSRRGAPGHAVGLRRGTVSGSCWWWSATHRGGWAELGQRPGGVARAEEGQRGGARAAAGLEVTHGSYQSRRWRRQSGSDGEWRWPMATERGQLGRTAERRGVLGESQQRGAKAASELGGNAWRLGKAGGDLGWRGTTACGGTVARQRRGQRRKKGGQGLICSFQKFQGPYCKPKFPTNLKFK
jgi:hypothetical protein